MLHIALVSHVSSDKQTEIKQSFDCELYDFHEDRDSLVRHGESIEIVFGNVRPFEFPQMKKLKWIQASWAGIENLLYPSLRSSDVIITNVRGQRATSMSEHAIAGLLYFCREFQLHAAANRRGERLWSEGQASIYGSTACILGTGGIGRILAAKLKALGAEVIGVSRSREGIEHCREMHDLDSVQSVLAEVDHLVCCLPATEATRGRIDRDFLMKLKPGARLVNLSRGAVLNEADLLECLASGQISGAVLDVSDPEPPEAGSPLWDNPKVLFTSHTSFLPLAEQGRDGLTVFKQNLDLFSRGEYSKMVNIVDKEAGY